MLSVSANVFNSQSFPDFELFKQSYSHVGSEKPAIISRGKQYQYRQLFRDILRFRNTYFNKLIFIFLNLNLFFLKSY